MSLMKTRLPWEKQWMSVHVGQVLQDMTVGCVEHWRWEALKGRMTHGPAIGEWQSRDDKSIYVCDDGICCIAYMPVADTLSGAG